MAPLLGELSSASETEGSPWLWDCQEGKEWSALRSVFSGLHRILPRRSLSPVCALGTSPKRGSALRGGGNALTDAGSALRGEKFSVYALGAPLRGAVERKRD